MPVPVWQPGTLYQPGDLVRPTSSGSTTQPQLQNPSFEDGNVGWTLAASNGTADIEQAGGSGPAFDGTWRLRLFANENSAVSATNNELVAVQPGDVVTVHAYVRWQTGDDARFSWLSLKLEWLTASMQLLTPSVAYPLRSAEANGMGALQAWQRRTIQAVAPAGAAFWRFRIEATSDDSDNGTWLVDAITLDVALQDPPNPFIFRAVQSAAGFSGNSEPEWPDTLGAEVIDNEVTWEAVSASNVTWEARRILVSGATEPTFPTGLNASVIDNTIAWTLDTRRVTDSRLPQSSVVLIAASKVFAANGDIINYSATVNPLDWSTPEDAGYIPFGLQTYGANPVTAMGLYRGNLAAFNSQGCQIWQLDPDPSAITILDAIPVPCTYPKSVQPVGDDLALLTDVGIRSLGLAGAQVNLSGGYFGKQVDPLVQPLIESAEAADYEPLGLYWPAKGQYWLFFGAEALVLTINGPTKEQRAWSRYVFPSPIDAWTIQGTDLLLRSGNLVWRVDDAALEDDVQNFQQPTEVGVPFTSVIQWPFLDLNNFNVDKELVGFDLAIDGECSVSFGWDQRSTSFAPTGPWTTPYEIDGDTVPGQMIPFSVTAPSFAMRLEFPSGQAWKWYSANLYIKDLSE